MNISAKLSAPILLAAMVLFVSLHSQEPPKQVKIKGQTLAVYPQTLERPPDILSPCVADNSTEWVTACTHDRRYAVVPVTVGDWNRKEVKYFGAYVLAVDKEDFPSLARTGLHAEVELLRARTINGRPIAEINELSRPGRLSTSGFMAEDEDVVSVLRGDDRLVRMLGLTHPQLARPLLHLWNLIREEQKNAQGIWSKGHAWVHFNHFLYKGKKIFYEAHFTKGGQKSPFLDGIEGGAHVFLWRGMDAGEAKFLENRYRQLAPEKLVVLKQALLRLTSGEMEPYYIVRYGFYEGHTSWRTDPIAIAFIFGLRSIEEIEEAFPG